jgi:hypothetical protein
VVASSACRNLYLLDETQQAADEGCRGDPWVASDKKIERSRARWRRGNGAVTGTGLQASTSASVEAERPAATWWSRHLRIRPAQPPLGLSSREFCLIEERELNMGESD